MSSDSQKLRVLIVEDDEASRSALSRLLTRAGYDAVSAATVSDGIAMVNERTQCVLLDLMLPDGNGVDVLRHVRDRDFGRGLRS